MPDLTANNFLDLLMSYPRGRIVACNIIDSLDEKLLKADSVYRLLDWWHQLYLWHVPRKYKGRMPPKHKEQDELMETLDLLLFEPQEHGFRPSEKKPFFLLECKRKPRLPKSDLEFVNVTTANVLIYNLMNEYDRRILAGSGKMVVMGQTTKAEIDTVLAKGKHQVRIKPGATVGRPNRLLWLTPVGGLKAELARIRSADCIRDRLGLIHYKAGAALVALHLPSKAVVTGEHGRPTAADAGSHARFKTRADSGINRRRSAWGYTADLEKLSSGKPTIDGLSERIAKPVPDARLGTITVTPLHHIIGTRGITSNDDHDAFANRLCSRCGGVVAIRKRLQAIFP